MAVCQTMRGSDPDELITMIRPVNGDVVAMGRGPFKVNALRVDFDRLWIQHLEEELPRIWQNAASSKRAAIWFLTRPGPGIAFQGTEVHTGDIAICPVGQPIWQRLTGSSSWGSMSLPLDEWVSMASAAGRDPFSSSAGLIMTPGGPNFARLQRLHQSAVHVARETPDLVENPGVARGFEQSLIHAMIECLQPPVSGRIHVPAGRRSVIMRRLWDAMDEFGDEPTYVPELCAKLRVPSRTLRTICHEYLGIGPKRYLRGRLRRSLR